MAGNLVVETHYTQNTSRPLTTEPDTYQQCNYQTFQMLILSVVDPLNSDEIRLKHLQNITEHIEILSTLPNYPAYIELLIKNFLRSLRETETVFIAQSNAQTIRKQMIEIFHRLPVNDALRSHVKEMLSTMFKLLTCENEDNALLLLRIIVELMKQFRPQMIAEVRDFLQFVHTVYRQKASALDQIFLTKSFSFPTMTIDELDLTQIVEQICSSVQLTVKKRQNLIPDEATSSTPPVVLETFTILSRAANSVKLLAEFPIAIVLLYQLCRQPLHGEFGDLVPLFLKYLTLQPSKEQRSETKFNMEIYIEFLTTQAKTLSFLAFVGKAYQDQLSLNKDLLVIALIQLLDGCPPENVQLRKDILVAARHFLNTDLRQLFVPHVKRFFDENLLLSTGYTAHETLKALAYNTFGEFFNQIRANLAPDELQNVLYIYSKMIHDPTLPPTVQVMSMKFLTNISEAIRQKASDKTRDLLVRIVEILVFKCKSVAKQCAQMCNPPEKSTSPIIPPIINEIDINTCSLNELMQNMNNITNREREIQRQQLAAIRFQPTAPLMCALSPGDCRALIKVLVSSLRHITWILADVKVSPENIVTQPKQFPPAVTILYIKFFKYALQCTSIFADSAPISTNNNPSQAPSRSKEEKEIMDMIASVFVVIHRQNYREIFESTLSYFYTRASINPNVTLIVNTLLQQSPSSTVLVELLLDFLLPRMDEIGENGNACLKLFKLVINSVVTTAAPNDNEKILQPHLQSIVIRSIECAQRAKDPMNYFVLLRALFRSIGVGNHELLNQEFLVLLNFLLQRLNEYQSCRHRQHLRELFIELCLTVPVRLSVLLPYLPLLMEPLVNALNGSSTLVLQGLRTLELCVDNLQPDFLYNHILPVRSSLMLSLYRLLDSSNNDVAQNTFRILGKLGGNNRRILNEPQRIQTEEEQQENDDEEEIYVQMQFDNDTRPITVPLMKILKTCAEQLKNSPNEQHQIKRQAWLIIRNILSVLISNDDDHDLITHLLNHSTFANGKISERPSVWNETLRSYHRCHDLLLQCLQQAATCKLLADEVLPLLKSTIQHYTLVALTQQTGPLASDTYLNDQTLDCSIIVIDSIISSYIDVDDELNAIGRISLDTLFQTLLTMCNGNRFRLTHLPLIAYLVDTTCAHCHDSMWYAKQGACRLIFHLCTNYFLDQTEWLTSHIVRFVRSLLFVLISLTDEISCGTLDSTHEMIKQLLGQCFTPSTNAHDIIGEFLEHLTSPIVYIRQVIFDYLRQLSQLVHQPLSRLLEPYKADLSKRLCSTGLLPLKNQPLTFQMALMDAYTFVRSLEPKLHLVSPIDEDLFKELTSLVLLDDNDLLKLPCYRLQQPILSNLIPLKKMALRTLAEFNDQIEYRERVLRLLYKILTTTGGELQQIAFECFERTLSTAIGHQNETFRARFVDNFVQQSSLYDNSNNKSSISPQIAQTFAYLSKLAPNSFDERLCEQLVNCVRKLLEPIVNTFRATSYNAQNQDLKACLILLDLLATIPISSKRIIEPLTMMILKSDKHLMIEASSPFRPSLIILLVRHPHLSLDQFISDDHRLQDPQWNRLFLDLLKSNNSATILTFVRTNWLDRFRQTLSDHVVSIESSPSISPVVCTTIRSLAILARTDPTWWSTQHELVSLLLRLWRSTTFQQHSLISSDHFDSFCSKELNSVLNLAMIYYRAHPERVRLLLELTRIYNCPEKLFYPKKFYDFVSETIVKTYPIKWKRDALVMFISLRQDESYSIECKALFLEHILLPSFAYEFEHGHQDELLAPIGPNNDESIVDLFVRTLMDTKLLPQINDKFRIGLLRFACLFLEYVPQAICDTTSDKRESEKIRRLMECAYTTLLMNNIDPTFKCQAHLLLCYIISKFAIVKKITLHVFNSLLKSHTLDAKLLVRQAADLLMPAMPIRIMDDNYDMLAYLTKKIIADEGHGNLQLIHVMSIIVRHQTIYYPVRHSLVTLMVQSAQKIAGQQTSSIEHRKLAIDIIEIVIKWELRRHLEQQQMTNDRSFNRPLIDTIFVFLIRHACQINAQTFVPLSQQCIRLFKIARKFAWPNIDVKLTTFERLIHQIELPNVSSHNSIAIAIDLLAFLISTFTIIQIKYTMRALKRFLITCITVTGNERLLLAMQNLFSKLIAQIPIDPPATIVPTTANTGPPMAQAQQLVQATLASLATAATPTTLTVNNSGQPMMNQLQSLAPSTVVNKTDDIEQFYTVITKTIIENMNGTGNTVVNTSDSTRTTINANPSTISFVHGLNVAFGYLRIIEKQQPKYVDKLTPHFTKLLQKLIKDHTSAGADYNSTFTEYIIECLTLLKFRIGQLTSDLRKQFMNNFLPCLIEKSHDISLIRAIIRLVFDWLKWRGDVQLVPSMKEKCQMLLKLLQCVDKARFHQQQQPTIDGSGDLTNSFLELILHVYQEPIYRELCTKLEAAFVLGLKSTSQHLRRQFFLILDKNLRKTLHDRLFFIFLSQNWEYLGQHYWIKQCLELFYTCASPNAPLTIADNRLAILPALTSIVKSGEFYDRYDFMVEYMKTKQPLPSENVVVKTEPNPSVQIKMEINDAPYEPAYSIISNALGVTAMSTLVTRPIKQRPSPITTELKAKHFRRSLSFENLRRFPLDHTSSSSKEMIERTPDQQIQLMLLIDDENCFLTRLDHQSKSNEFFDSIVQFIHTIHSPSIDTLTHHLFIDLLPKIVRLLPEKYRTTFFQQIIQPFLVSGAHLQQRDVYPYSALHTLLESFAKMFINNNSPASLVPFVRPSVLKYVGKTHNTWHRSILLLEQFILDQSSQQEDSLSTDEISLESINALCELYDHLNEDDYLFSLWLQRLTINSKSLLSNALRYEQLGLFKPALECYTQVIKTIDNDRSISSSSSSINNRFLQLDEFSLLERHWISCTKELNQWDTLMAYCKQQTNRDHLLYLECAWKSGNWPLVKETLGQLDAMCNGTNVSMTNVTNTSATTTFQLLNPTSNLSHSTIISNILTLKDFQWKIALYRCYLTLCSAVAATDDPTVHQTTMNVTERLVDFCSLIAIKEWKHLPFYVTNSHINLLQASQRIIEVQESAQILLNIQTNPGMSNGNTSTSIISTTSNGSSTTTTTSVRQVTNIHELKTIVKTWKSRLPLVNDPLSFWHDIFTWRELQYTSISSQFDKDSLLVSTPGTPTGTNSNTGQVLLGIHAIAQSITHLGKIARKHHMPTVCMDILSRIGRDIPSVPVVDSFQKIKQIIKCYLIFLPTLSSGDIQETFELIEQANTKYFNRDMMSEFYALKALAYSQLNRMDDAQKLFSCATQLADNNLTRAWINWGDFLLKQQQPIADDELVLICYLNACKDLIEVKARPIMAKIFWVLSRDDISNNNKLSICIERHLSLIPVHHWLFWLPQIMNKLIRNESTQCMIAILIELTRIYPQVVYVRVKKYLTQLLTSKDEKQQPPMTPGTPSIEYSLNVPTISLRQQAIDNLNRLQQTLLEQHPTIVRTLDMIIQQLNTINESIYEYIVKRLYLCQRRIYQNLYDNRMISDEIRRIIEQIKQILENENENKPIRTQFVQDFNESLFTTENNNHFPRALLLIIGKWLTLLEHRIEQSKSRISYLNPKKCALLLSFTSQITNDIDMPGELWHAPEANFFFRINRFLPQMERIFKFERYFVRLTLRAHNGKYVRYLLANDFCSNSSYDEWQQEENTIQFLKMINNSCIRKQKELLRRHMQIFVPHSCSYLPWLRLIEENISTINVVSMYNDRLMIPLRKYYELYENEEEQFSTIYKQIQEEYFHDPCILQRWTWHEYSNPTGYFAFRKMFTLSIGFYSTLNSIFGFQTYTNNQVNIQRSIGNINPFYFKLKFEQQEQQQELYLTPNIDLFINRFGKMGPLTATILATVTSLAESKHQIVQLLKIFYKEHVHIQHPDLSQQACVELVDDLAHRIETKLMQFVDFNNSKMLVSQLVQNSTKLEQLARRNPLEYPWL